MAGTKKFKVEDTIVDQINVNGGSDNVVMTRVNGNIVYQKQLPTPDIYYAERGFNSAIVEYISNFSEEVSVNVNFGAFSDTFTIPAGSSVEKEWTGLSQDTHYSSSCYTTLYPWKNSEVRSTVDLITFKGVEVSEGSRTESTVTFNIINNNTTALEYQMADNYYGPWSTQVGSFTGTKTRSISRLNPITSITKYFRLYDHSSGNFSSYESITLKTRPGRPSIAYQSKTARSIKWRYSNHSDNNVSVTLNAVLREGTTVVQSQTKTIASDSYVDINWTGLDPNTPYNTRAYLTYNSDDSTGTTVNDVWTKQIPPTPTIEVLEDQAAFPYKQIRVDVTNTSSYSGTLYLYNRDLYEINNYSVQGLDTQVFIVDNLEAATEYEFYARFQQDGVYSELIGDSGYTNPEKIRFSTYSSPTENRLAWRYYNDSPSSITAQIAIRRGTTVIQTSTITISGNSSKVKYWYNLDSNTSYSTRARAVFQGLYSSYTYSSTQTTITAKLATPSLSVSVSGEDIDYSVTNNHSEAATIHFGVYNVFSTYVTLQSNQTFSGGRNYLSPGSYTFWAQAKKTGEVDSNIATRNFTIAEEETTTT